MAKSITTASVYICRLGVLIVAISGYFYVPGLQDFFGAVIGYLQSHDFEGLRQLIRSYGPWAPVVSIALMIIQSLVPFVPGLVITITNAWIFGWQYGALYSWCGALLGAILDFGLARWYGRLVVEGIVNIKYLSRTDAFLQKYGFLAVFIARLTPIIPFKVVSYVAGLTAMPFWKFAFATAIGQAPAIMLYSIIGQNITQGTRIAILVPSLLISIGVVAYHYQEEIKGQFFSNKEK